MILTDWVFLLPKHAVFRGAADNEQPRRRLMLENGFQKMLSCADIGGEVGLKLIREGPRQVENLVRSHLSDQPRHPRGVAQITFVSLCQRERLQVHAVQLDPRAAIKALQQRPTQQTRCACDQDFHTSSPSRAFNWLKFSLAVW